MHRHRFAGTAALLALAVATASGCSPSEVATELEDRAFAVLQARGEQAMGVDQYTSTHRFDALPDGGRIALQRDSDDPAGVEQIRRHLRSIAEAFASGDFGTPAFVHGRDVPGTAVMAARRDRIEYVYRDLPHGGELRLVTSDPAALRAIHEFAAFQRTDHHAGGIDDQPPHHGRIHHAHAPGGGTR